MAEPFLTEIRLMSFQFAPKGWALCNGQLIPIQQNQAIFALIGTMFGGDGQVNFALPDLRSRTPIHVGHGHTLGERGGELLHTLTTAELPEHGHRVRASGSEASSPIPGGNVLADSVPNEIYAQPDNLTALNSSSTTSTGGSQAHLNMQPFLTLNFVIALQGIFPSPN